jgi:3-hydroxyacyl-CoA dehydrogenase
MPLVEVIRGVQRSDAMADAVRELAERIAKSPISVRNASGFVVMRCRFRSKSGLWVSRDRARITGRGRSAKSISC